MITWYKDKELAISFSKIPNVSVRYITPYSTKEEKKSIDSKPFINKSDLSVKLEDFVNNKTYIFIIPQYYTWDGATIPRVFWRLIGAKTDNKFLIPSLVHDVLCENHHYVDNDRYFADKVFERLLCVSRVSSFNRWLMFHSVDNFQKFCKWEK